MEAEDRQSYFLTRAQEARFLAEEATDDRVRTLHLEMTIRYELSAEESGITGPADDDFSDDEG